MRFGRYELLDKLASGGMGEVYRARVLGAAGFQKFVAVKRIKPHRVASQEYQERFILEAKVAAELAHPNIVQVLDLGTHDGELFLAMEYIDGTSVHRLLDRLTAQRLRLAPELVAVLAFDVLEALDYAHGYRTADGKPLKLVHRDVTPQNIMVSVHGVAKLCDFGVVRVADRATAVGKLRGKVPYMSPEQVRGEPLDGRADIYSLAVVLHEALRSAPLFRGDDLETLAHRIEHEAVPALGEVAQVPERIASAVMRGLAKNRDDRFASAAEARAAVEAYLLTIDAAAARRALGALALTHREAPASEAALRSGTQSVTHVMQQTADDARASSRWTHLVTQLAPSSRALNPTLPLGDEASAGLDARHSRPRLLVALGIMAFTALAVIGVALQKGVAPPQAQVTTPSAARVDPRSASALPPAPEPSAVPPAAPRPASVSRRAPETFGYLSINADPWAHVVLNGRRFDKTTPLIRHKVPTGKHRVQLIGPTGKVMSFDVEVRRGEVATRSVVLE